ncbi:hypothetical protein H6P81_002503 [Aristolochia fimbriata]|uniref:R3H-associated N-terminal domain-containing protein n=1 Tax=Aristolochia fimbriata TaxID=158543 RepID=A0AAV7F9Z0_ARIFI|nr:hypothetical protein H6P81_002503 [Aristolochia fimbriata]
METSDTLQFAEEDVSSSNLINPQKGETRKSRSLLLEKKIEFLESLASKVSNRRSRRWLNDRLLIELVPRLNADEIRGLFAPPPWGDNVPLSPFCMTNGKEWEPFRNIDMDSEATLLEALEKSSTKRKDRVETDKIIALNAWHRVDCRTREALRRNFLSELVEGFEECIRAFIKESGDNNDLVLHIQDSYHRLLLHGVCEFYDLISVTATKSERGKLLKMTKISKKRCGCRRVPNMTLTHFLKMAKEGVVV